VQDAWRDVIAERDHADHLAAADHPPTADNNKNDNNNSNNNAATSSAQGNVADAAASAPGAHQPALGRRLMLSHHIIAKRKREVIREWALELGLASFCKIGWPGVIVCEGPEDSCQEYASRLQSLRWQHFTIRGEEVVPVGPGQAVDDLRVLPRGVQELGENDMSRLAEICREAGLEDLFKTCLK